MKQDTTRYICRKIYFSEAEDKAVTAKCAAAGKSVSAMGRELFRQMQSPAHRTPGRRRREGPRLGPALAEIFKGRRGGALVPMRL